VTFVEQNFGPHLEQSFPENVDFGPEPRHGQDWCRVACHRLAPVRDTVGPSSQRQWEAGPHLGAARDLDALDAAVELGREGVDEF
jgi:hypothetical protein